MANMKNKEVKIQKAVCENCGKEFISLWEKQLKINLSNDQLHSF